ncbi:MAG: bifunctional diaminohydroxyphosphoribosylaminopyrimidine deaminase/5-amino-6-(5-phosphoribosylamino)uracil reductase RibD [Rubrivivax sp.]|nr:bifunctional diaminohydroxyphosphoribosylaminopyrimidine deaminase/5-amino-6-(5-phosphoribosylamino)uracil reductase RibD [Rubrivivax sp.]
MTPLDRERLQEALAEAGLSIGLSEPNPRVGCVLGRPDGTVIGRGHTQRDGGPHAEVMALQDAQSAGQDPQGATAWVTLEPCSHHGRTPPCSDALIAAGLARVVVAVGDPHHQVNGAGLERLRAAGIQVDMADADLALLAREINIGFFSRMERGRPWTRLKIASSLDGFTALLDGSSKWITSDHARRDGHMWRRRAGAVLTGAGTVLADDPRLDVRDVPGFTQPLRVVLDSRYRTPASARVLQPPGQCLVYGVSRPNFAALAGVEQVEAPAQDGRVDLPFVLQDLAHRRINELHVEAGATLSGSLLRHGLIDELLVYIAPRLLGKGRRFADLPAPLRLSAEAEWTCIDQALIGPDLRLRLRLRPKVSENLTNVGHT